MTSLTRTEQQISPAPHPTGLDGVRVAVEIKGQGVIIPELQISVGAWCIW